MNSGNISHKIKDQINNDIQKLNSLYDMIKEKSDFVWYFIAITNKKTDFKIQMERFLQDISKKYPNMQTRNLKIINCETNYSFFEKDNIIKNFARK